MPKSLHNLLSPYCWQWNIYTFVTIFLFSITWVYFASLFDGQIKYDRLNGSTPSDIQKDRMEYKALLVTLWCTSIFYTFLYVLIFGLIEKFYHERAATLLRQIIQSPQSYKSAISPNFNWFNPITWEPEWWFVTTLVVFGIFFAAKEVTTIKNQRQFWIDLWNNPYQAKKNQAHSDYTYPSEAIVKTFATMGLGMSIIVYVIFSIWGLLFSVRNLLP